ncbi:MAG: radical SAM protein [Acidobacteriota bacterium]
MIGQRKTLGTLVSLFRDPVTAEKRRLLADRWSALPDSLRRPTQGLGQKATGCGATIGVQPKCDFSCTGCYLGAEANTIPPLPLAQVLEQLDTLRAHLGPKSNVQITDGEVTLRPIEELLRILTYARSIGIVPMVMTHGDNLRKNPGLLERLMVDGSLTEISIHIDITQRGRLGYRLPASEVELMPLRDEFAAMIRSARKKTGLRLRAAQTLTVTQENLPQISDVVTWSIHNRDAFSLISFQPMAHVGRTREGLQGVTSAELWREVSRATERFGLPFTGPDAIQFGHPQCTRFVPLLVVDRNDAQPELIQFVRNSEEDIAIMGQYMESGIAGAAFRDDWPMEMLARGAGMVKARPRWIVGKGLPWMLRKIRDGGKTSITSFVLETIRGKARLGSFTLTSHHFMSPAELETELGKERLDACIFKVPVNGEMIPMCAVNAAGSRERFYGQLASAAH